MVPSLRRSGIMVTRRLSASKRRPFGPEEVGAAEGLEPHGLAAQRIFVPLGFRRRHSAFVSGLSSHFRRCPSSLYTFPFGAWLGIAMLKGSPNLSILHRWFPGEHSSFSLKSDASADSATPRGLHRFYPSCSAAVLLLYFRGLMILMEAASNCSSGCEA